jgi:rhodanese-related sulfurtransferase
MAGLFWGLGIIGGVAGLAIALLTMRRASWLTKELKQVKRDQYYADGRLKRIPEEIREAIEPLRVQLASVAKGGRVSSEMILDGRLYIDVTADDARRTIEQHEARTSGKVIVIDVRSPREYAARHVPGARLVPFDELETRYRTDIPETAEQVFVYCMGGERSRSACTFLSRQGYTNLFNIKDGLQGWRGAVEGEGELKMVHFQPPGVGRDS